MERIFLAILNRSLTAGILVMVVLFVRLLLRKAPKWISCLLWAIVAVRLVCPFSVESIFSLVPSSEPIPENITVMQNPEITTGIPMINNAVNPVLSNTLTPEPGAGANPMQIVLAVASGVWMIGMVVLFAYAVISYLILYKKVRESVLFTDRVKICDHIETPFIFGVLDPHIFIPSGLSGERLEHVMAHENAHLKRLDHMWKPVGFLILTLHWFNPLVWLAYILLCKDIEIACDEKVIRDMEKKEAASYSQTLLECSLERRNILKCPLAFGEVSVKERIDHVLHFKKPAFWIVFIAVLSCLIVAVCFLTNPRKDICQIKITVPANSDSAFYFADAEISPLKGHFKVSVDQTIGDSAIVIEPVEVKTETAYDKEYYVTPGMDTKIEAEKNGWFRIGLHYQNLTDKDMDLSITVEHVDVRIGSRAGEEELSADLLGNEKKEELPLNQTENSVADLQQMEQRK